MVGSRIRAGKRVNVCPVRKGKERLGIVFRDFLHELIYIFPGRNMKRSCKLPIDGMIDDDIQNRTAGIHEEFQLPAHSLHAVPADHGTDITADDRNGHYIAAGRCGNIFSGGAKHGDIADNDLSAY